MADDTTEAQTSTTEAETNAPEPTTDAPVDQPDPAPDGDTPAEGGDDSSLMGGAGKKADDEPKAEEISLPEKYELTAPEGLSITDDVLAEIDPVFRELKLDNDAANKVIGLAGPFAERLHQAQVDAHLATAAQWAKEAKDDPEIGKGNWAETETLVAKALDRFGAPEGSPFRQLLDETKLGNHPELIRMFRKIGAATSEDMDFPRPDAGAQDKKGRLEVLYPDDVPKEPA